MAIVVLILGMVLLTQGYLFLGGLITILAALSVLNNE